MNSYGVEKAVVIRYPSTANLMVDSADRNTTLNPSPWDFQITKPQSTMNGYFTRIGTTEVVLEWCMPNILDGTITFDISGAAVRSTISYQILNTFFNMAELLNNIVSAFDNENGVTFTVSQANGQVSIDSANGKFIIVSTPLAVAAGLPVGGALSTSKPVGSTGLCPDLRRFRYLDFTSPQITYAQDLKDNSTQAINRDVLCRWYMAEDTQESYDAYGFPILMGYEPFVRRRLFNPPKQIKWDNNIPLGNLAFQVFDDQGDILALSASSNFLMTLQLSEN